MAQVQNGLPRSGTVVRPRAEVDEGLRSYMLSVYNYMSAGIALTGIVAYATYAAAASNPDIAQLLYGSPLRWVIMLAPLAFVFYLSFRVYNMSPAAAQVAFWAFAAVMGVSLSSIFMVFTGNSIAQVFFITAAAFAGLSMYGYTTKSDLSGWGSFLIMGVIGLIIAGLVNIFMQSSALMFAINVLGVLIFAALTAYDTQQIKDGYYQVRGDGEALAKSAIMGALSLYLDFINMFTSLLSLFGDRE
ncbi:MAG: Bax inhibitor-1/YccA family protein [Hyphomicrobium sp.]|nr:Bax inhibitor-1/YccA family protein [Hyphomicrobium sp.]